MSQEARTRGERLHDHADPGGTRPHRRFPIKYRMPSRASAVRELLSRGRSAEGFAVPTPAHIPQNLVLPTINEWAAGSICTSISAAKVA